MEEARLTAYQQEASDREEVRQACEQPFDLPEIALLKSKIPPLTRPPSIDQLSDRTAPSTRQKAAVKALDSLLEHCRIKQGWLENRYSSATYPAYVASSERTRTLLSQLGNGTITFGQYNTGRQEIMSLYEQEGTELEQQVAMAREQWAARDAERRASEAAWAEWAERRPICKRERGKLWCRADRLAPWQRDVSMQWRH